MGRWPTLPQYKYNPSLQANGKAPTQLHARTNRPHISEIQYDLIYIKFKMTSHI